MTWEKSKRKRIKEITKLATYTESVYEKIVLLNKWNK